MSDQGSMNSGSTDAVATSAVESAEAQGYAAEPAVAAPASAARTKGERDEQMRRNLRDTFGSGPGKLALMAAAVVVVIFAALALSGLRGGQQVASDARVDAPSTPQNRVTTNPVTPEEAARRAAVAAAEADKAKNDGTSYQPGFDYNIGPLTGASAAAPAQFPNFAGPEQAASGASPARNLGQTGQSNPQKQTQQDEARAEAQLARAAEKLENEVKQAEAERDKYIEGIKTEIVKQIGGMFASDGGASLNNVGSFSQARYYSPPAPTQAQMQANGSTMMGGANQARRPIIKAGTTMYATLDSEANTDDGRLTLATIRGGPWNGAKIIGQIEQAYDNISLVFTSMAPQDERPTMRVRAVALREVDAKVGMAETIDHHTFSRYTALAAAAILSGAGRVYQQPVGTTIVTPGGIVTQTEEPTDRRVIGSAVGELGTSLGSEIRRRGFNRPSTYATPAQQGFVLYFLEDVAPANGAGNQAGMMYPLVPTVSMGAAPASPAAPMVTGFQPPQAGVPQGLTATFPAGTPGINTIPTPMPYGVQPYGVPPVTGGYPVPMQQPGYSGYSAY